jgi:hypothetical protein
LIPASKVVRPRFEWSVLIIYVWLLSVTLFMLFQFVFPVGSVTATKAIAPMIELKKDQNKYEVAFNLIPDSNTNGRVMNLSLPQMVFDRLIRYDVCCAIQAYYVCRAVTRNLGVDCFLNKDKMAVINILHPDMVGARCTLLWNERI